MNILSHCEVFQLRDQALPRKPFQLLSLPNKSVTTKAEPVAELVPMSDGRWAMGDGRWTMGDGRWAVGDGQWAMGNGRWAMGGGR